MSSLQSCQPAAAVAATAMVEEVSIKSGIATAAALLGYWLRKSVFSS